jgi:hypothetical protein
MMSTCCSKHVEAKINTLRKSASSWSLPRIKLEVFTPLKGSAYIPLRYQYFSKQSARILCLCLTIARFQKRNCHSRNLALAFITFREQPFRLPHTGKRVTFKVFFQRAKHTMCRERWPSAWQCYCTKWQVGNKSYWSRLTGNFLTIKPFVWAAEVTLGRLQFTR